VFESFFFLFFFGFLSARFPPKTSLGSVVVVVVVRLSGIPGKKAFWALAPMTGTLGSTMFTP